MISLDVQVQIVPFLKELDEASLRRAPIAVKQAINVTLGDAEQAVLNAMRQKFRYSSAGWRWMKRHVKVFRPGSRLLASEIGSLANRGAGHDMRGWIGIFPPEGRGQHAGFSRYRGSLLAAMEEGGPTPGPRDFGGVIGLGRYAVPITRYDARPRFPKSLFPANLGLSSRQGISGPMTAGRLRGKRRTFLLPVKNATGHAVIYQRFGRKGSARGLRGSGDDNIMALFWTQPETRLPARHYFVPTVDLIVRSRLPLHLTASMHNELFGRGAYRG